MIDSTFYFKLMNCTDINVRASNVVGFSPKREFLPILFPGITPPYNFDAMDDTGSVYHLQYKIAPVSGQAYIQNQMQQYINTNCALCDTLSLEIRRINGSSPQYYLSRAHISDAIVLEKSSSSYICVRNDEPKSFPFSRQMYLNGSPVDVRIDQIPGSSPQEYSISIDGSIISSSHHKKDLFLFHFIVLDLNNNVISAMSSQQQSIQRIIQL